MLQTTVQTKYWHIQISSYLPGMEGLKTNRYIYVDLVLIKQQEQNLKTFQYS